MALYYSPTIDITDNQRDSIVESIRSSAASDYDFGESITDAYFEQPESESEVDAQLSTAPTASRSQSHTDAPTLSVTSMTAPGNNDDVLCPFCNEALPPDVFEAHAAAAAANNTPRRPATAELDTTDAVTPTKPRFGLTAPTPLDTAAPAPPTPVVTTDSLRESVDDAEDKDVTASKLVVSDEDIRRWSSLAGVTVKATPKPAPAAVTPAPAPVAETKVFPLLPPPPAPAAAAAARAVAKGNSDSRSSSRFGFFARNKSADDEESDDDNLDDASGYAMLGAPPSDDEDDGYESDKPFSSSNKPAAKSDETEDLQDDPQPPSPKEPIVVAPTDVAPPPAPPTSNNSSIGDADLRSVLTEVLERIQALSRSHAELSTSHSTLLTSLKIARSNLVMAEANTEMLEEELKRAKAAVTSAPPTVGRFTQPGVPRNSTDQARASLEGTRPASIAGAGGPGSAPQTGTAGNGGKGGFGFWGSSNGKKKSALSSPTDSEHRIPQRAGSVSVNRDDELRQLREQLESQASEVEALKVGKKEIEAELEGLSQALFEEANKMVADERKKRAEVEENLREVRDEREALRQTIKVLGGPTPKPGTPAPPEEAPQEEPRDLDRHYAALRRSIHHAIDGPTPEPREQEGSDRDGGGSDTSDERERDFQSARASSADDASEASDQLHHPRPTLASGLPPPPVSFDEANPWAVAAS